MPEARDRRELEAAVHLLYGRILGEPEPDRESGGDLFLLAQGCRDFLRHQDERRAMDAFHRFEQRHRAADA